MRGWVRDSHGWNCLWFPNTWKMWLPPVGQYAVDDLQLSKRILSKRGWGLHAREAPTSWCIARTSRDPAPPGEQCHHWVLSGSTAFNQNPHSSASNPPHSPCAIQCHNHGNNTFCHILHRMQWSSNHIQWIGWHFWSCKVDVWSNLKIREYLCKVEI